MTMVVKYSSISIVMVVVCLQLLLYYVDENDSTFL